MTTTARLLLLLSTSLPLLPLAACAAQPVQSAPSAGTDSRQVAPVQSGAENAASPGRAAAVPAAPAVTPAPTPVPASATPVPARAVAPSSAVSATAPAAASTVQPRAAQSAPAGTSEPANASAAAGDTTAPLGAIPVQETPATTTAPAAAIPGTMPAPAQPLQAGAPAGSLWQTLLALVAVLALLGALAWFLKRYGPKAGGGTANLRIVGSLNLGGRERLLVVEVGSQWIVVGASPGRVNALATMPRQEADAAGGTHAGTAALAPHGPAANSFADWLKQTIDKRK